MLKDNEWFLSHVADYFNLSYSRVRGIIKELGIRPKRFIGNQPVYLSSIVGRIEARNTKPGPRKNGGKK